MLMIHVEDNGFTFVTGSFTDKIVSKHVQTEDPSSKLKEIKEIASQFIGSDLKTVIFTGTISNVVVVNQEATKPQTLASLANDLIKLTISSCFKQLPSQQRPEYTTIDGTALIANAPVFVSIGTRSFEESVNIGEIKKSFLKEINSIANPVTPFRKKRLQEALKVGGDVDVLFNLHKEFFENYKTCRFFVDSRVSTEGDDLFLVNRYLEITRTLRCELKDSIEGEYVLLPSPREENYGMRRRLSKELVSEPR